MEPDAEDVVMRGLVLPIKLRSGLGGPEEDLGTSDDDCRAVGGSPRRFASSTKVPLVEPRSRDHAGGVMRSSR